jgi:hypothetical protein
VSFALYRTHRSNERLIPSTASQAFPPEHQTLIQIRAQKYRLAQNLFRVQADGNADG